MRRIHGSGGLAAAWVLVSVAVGVVPGAAQHARVDCAALTAALRQNVRRVEAWSDIPRCGAVGAAAVASALERNRASADVAFWTRFGDVAWLIRHPALLDAALRVAADSSASFPARALGLQLALAQHDINANFVSGGHPLALEWILAHGADPRGVPGNGCIMPALGWIDATYMAALPADADARTIRTADAVAADRRAPRALRHIARCIGEELRGHRGTAGHGHHSH